MLPFKLTSPNVEFLKTSLYFRRLSVRCASLASFSSKRNAAGTSKCRPFQNFTSYWCKIELENFEFWENWKLRLNASFSLKLAYWCMRKRWTGAAVFKVDALFICCILGKINAVSKVCRRIFEEYIQKCIENILCDFYKVKLVFPNMR